MLRNVGRAVIVKGGKDSSLDCALFNTYRRPKESSDADPSRVRPRSRAALHDNIEATDLVDIYRVLNEDRKDFTWRNRGSINR